MYADEYQEILSLLSITRDSGVLLNLFNATYYQMYFKILF